MPILPVPRRRNDPELMDAPGLPEAEVAEAYRVLRRVNRQFFGSGRSFRAELDRWLASDRPQSGSTLTILDVGSGSGDLPDSASKRLADLGFRAHAIALDLDPVALRLLRSSGQPTGAIRGNALRLPIDDASIDLVTAAKFAHHFEGRGLIRLVAEMARVARRRVVVLEIRRSWAAYVGFWGWSRIFTRSRLVRYDGPLSVLRGFTADELAEVGAAVGRVVPGYRWEVRRIFGFQLALIGSRRD